MEAVVLIGTEGGCGSGGTRRSYNKLVKQTRKLQGYPNADILEDSSRKIVQSNYADVGPKSLSSYIGEEGPLLLRFGWWNP